MTGRHAVECVMITSSGLVCCMALSGLLVWSDCVINDCPGNSRFYLHIDCASCSGVGCSFRVLIFALVGLENLHIFACNLPCCDEFISRSESWLVP